MNEKTFEEKLAEGSSSQLEAALIRAAGATDAAGLKIMLFRPPMKTNSKGEVCFFETDFNRVGSAALCQIRDMCDGIPLFSMSLENLPKDPKDPYRNHAKNIQLLLDIYKAWIEEGPL